MKTRTRWITGFVLVAIIVVLGARGIQARRAAQQAAAAPPAAEPAVELAPTDLARAEVITLARTVDVSGGLAAVRSALVKARIAAEIQTIAVREGEAVRAGQVLVRLDDSEVRWRLRQAEDQAAASQAQVTIAQRALDNNRALVDQGFISKNALDTSASNLAGAQASLRAAQAAAGLARKSVADATLRSPLSGLVSQRFMQPGERAGIDARILEIVDLSRIELTAALAPEDAAALRVGQRAQLTVEGRSDPVAARVARINPSAQAGTRAVLAYLALDPAPDLRQGLFARGRIELERRDTLVVPTSAVRVDQAAPYVLVARDGRIVQVEVKPGQRGEAAFGAGTAAEPAIEIVSGLQRGETVLRGTVGALRGGTVVKLPA